MLKGFASGEGRNDPNVWFYGRGLPGRERNIANISVENYFYGTPEESDLDQRITLLEEDFLPKRIRCYYNSNNIVGYS